MGQATQDLGEKSISESICSMCKEGEVEMGHVCFQSIKMAGLLGAEEGLGLEIFICPKQHPHLLWETLETI